jgi:phosphoserine phosphatase RsbU/P
MPQISDEELLQLQNAVDELRALNDIASAINVSMSVESITHTTLEHCLKRTGATQGVVFLLEDKSAQDKFKTFVREISPTGDQMPFRINMTLSGWMIKNKAILLSNDPETDPRIKAAGFAKVGIHSVLAAPLLARDGLLGLYVLFNKAEGGFTDSDSRFLGIVGTQTAKVIDNARLFEKEEERKSMQKELDVAKDIQRNFLPKHNIQTELCEVYGFNEPAKQVGGDFYDMVEIEPGRLFVSLGDVAGKGLPAAMHMSTAQAVVRSQLGTNTGESLAKVASSLNLMMCHFMSPGEYITALFGFYDRTKEKLFYVNAGHLPIIIHRRDGAIEHLRESDVIIGIIPEMIYNVHEVAMFAGDTAVWYTDGITECFDSNNKEFGEARLNAAVLKTSGMTAVEVGQSILHDVLEFRGPADQSDDITLLVLKAH